MGRKTVKIAVNCTKFVVFCLTPCELKVKIELEFNWEELKMAFLRGLLLAESGELNSGSIKEIAESGYDTFKSIINIVLPIILGVVLLVGTVYAIILGVNYSKAEDADKRKEAKDRLVGAVVGFLIALVLIAVIYGVLSANFIANMFK